MSWRNFKFWLMKKMCSEAEWNTLLNIRQGFYDYQEEVKQMTRQEAADCLLDKVNCQYCDQADGDCRKEAIDMAARSLKAWDDVMKEIDEATEIHTDGEFYIRNIDVTLIIHKHMKEVEENEDRNGSEETV